MFYGHFSSTGLLDAYVGCDLGRMSLRLAGKNLTDDRYWTTGFSFSVILLRFLGDPRTVMISVAFKL